jgi:hypothetical protein
MKTLFGLVVLAGLVYGGYRVFAGPSHADRAHKACENIAELCANADFTRHDVAECTTDLQDPPAKYKSEVGTFVDCAADANSCGEVVGCLAGVGAALDSDLRDFGKGFDRVRKH